MDFSLIERHLRPAYYKKQTNAKLTYVGLSPQVYFHFISHIDDDYLTDWEVMKFRSIFRTKMLESYIAPITLTSFFYLTAHRYLRLYAHRIVFYRGLKIMVAINFGVMSYVLMNCYMWPNKQLHELVTQPEPNGQYLRNVLKENFPRHWSMMSKQLHDLGYNFREMNEYSQKAEMPDVTDKFDNSMY